MADPGDFGGILVALPSTVVVVVVVVGTHCVRF